MLAYKIGQTTMDVLRELHVGWQENTTISAVPQRMGVFVFFWPVKNHNWTASV